jgi:hypothetical protein
MRISRQEIRKARDAGLAVRELTAADLRDPAVRARLDAVSGDWMRTKRVADRQLRVYCRHFDPEDLAEQLDGEVRLFVAERRPPVVGGGPSAFSQSEGGAAAVAASLPLISAAASLTLPSSPSSEPAIEGFMLVDPMYKEDGTVFGYVNSSNRMRPGAHPGTLKLLMDHVLEEIRACPQKEFLHLGLTPFHHSKRCADHFPGGARWMDFGTEFFFQLGNNLYAFKRLAAAKSKFGGGIAEDGESYNDPSVIMSHVYVAHSVRVPFLFLMDMYAQFEYIGFVGDDILSSLVKGLAPPVKKEAKPVLNQVGRKELRRMASVESSGGSISLLASAGSASGGGPLVLRTASSGGATVLRAAPPKVKGAKAVAQDKQQDKPLRAPPRPPALATVSSAPAGLATPPLSAPRRVSRPPPATLPPMPGSPPAVRLLDASEDAAITVADSGDSAEGTAPAAVVAEGKTPTSAGSGSAVSLTAVAAGGSPPPESLPVV